MWGPFVREPNYCKGVALKNKATNIETLPVLAARRAFRVSPIMGSQGVQIFVDPCMDHGLRMRRFGLVSPWGVLSIGLC
jgi:hypothetical protein